jgi:hypothetical protein
MAFLELRHLNACDVEPNPTMPAPSIGEWRDFLSKCNSNVDVLAARWNVDPAVLRTVCEDGATRDGMSDLVIETICSPSFSAEEAPSHDEAKLLYWIYCEMEPWGLEKQFWAFSRPHLEDLNTCLTVKVWSPQVHRTAVTHCVEKINHEGLLLALNKVQTAVALGEFENQA